VQLDFLITGQTVAPRIVELARTYRLPIAFQTNLFYGGQGKGAACGGHYGAAPACTEATERHSAGRRCRTKRADPLHRGVFSRTRSPFRLQSRRHMPY